MALGVTDDNRYSGHYIVNSKGNVVDFVGSGIAPISFEERLIRDGEPWTAHGFNSVAVSHDGTNTNQTIASTGVILPLVAKTVWLETVTLSANITGIFQLNIAGSADTRFPGIYQTVALAAGVSATIPIRQLMRPHMIQSSSLTISLRKALVATPVDVFAAISVAGYKMTDDVHYTASKTILAIGDSILNGTSGPSKTSLVWPMQVRDYYRAQGSDARVVLKSQSSSTTTENKNWMDAGYLDISTPPDLVIYAVGVNDAGAAVAAATYLANITATWQYVSARWPNAKMLICGITPVENTTTHNNAETYRTNAQAYVASVNSPRLKYLNLGTAFTRTTTTFYASTDTAGSRVHLSDTGHTAVADLVKAWAPANLPSL